LLRPLDRGQDARRQTRRTAAIDEFQQGVQVASAVCRQSPCEPGRKSGTLEASLAPCSMDRLFVDVCGA
jgi:hypothetical protein